MAILAGGLATRLGPLTAAIPKSLIDIGGRPFIDYQLQLLKRQGISEIVLCVGHLGELVEQHVGRGDDFGLRVEYSWDGKTALGTGGSLRKAAHLLADTFFIMYGDSYLLCDFSEVAQCFADAGSEAMMTVYQNDNLFDRSNVQYEGGKIVRYDKSSDSGMMRHIDYGLGMMRRAVLEQWPPDQKTDLATIYQALLMRGTLEACPVRDRFYEIGSRSGIEDFVSFAAEHKILG
ncbi:MAG: sugar phosphate nucleotidyltransferase [Acidobacteria bacterium]|nr:sugar phosphate nucleotidyltransferase [Acidobacteriota bacterium]